MSKITLKDVLEVTGGKLVGAFSNLSTEIDAICSNTRGLKDPSMFIPYKGSNVDGHDYIDEALEKGCIGCLIQKELKEYRDDKFYVLVDDVLESVWKLVDFRRKQINATLICVTGSVGKTTTTGMIANVLRQQYRVFETEDNRNDEFLGPEMIFKIKDDDEFAVIELGMGEHSSVSKMAKILQPDVVVLTRIGHAHIGKTGSLEATTKEKCSTEEGLPTNGIVVVNSDDKYLMSYPYKHRVVTYSRIGAGYMLPSNLLYAASAALTVGKLFYVPDRKITDGLTTYVPAEGRMDIVKKERFTLIDSSFNASIESMEMALGILSKYRARRIAVLGEMLEIGNYADELHSRLGSLITPNICDVLIAVGEHADCVKDAADIRVSKYAVKTIAEAWSIIAKLFCESRGNDVILCKGSHASGIYKIAEHLREIGE